MRCSAQNDAINETSPRKMKISLNIILSTASFNERLNAFGKQKMRNSRMLKTIAIIDTKMTLRGNTFEAFTIPQTAKS